MKHLVELLLESEIINEAHNGATLITPPGGKGELYGEILDYLKTYFPDGNCIYIDEPAISKMPEEFTPYLIEDDDVVSAAYFYIKNTSKGCMINPYDPTLSMMSKDELDKLGLTFAGNDKWSLDGVSKPIYATSKSREKSKVDFKFYPEAGKYWESVGEVVFDSEGKQKFNFKNQNAHKIKNEEFGKFTACIHEHMVGLFGEDDILCQMFADGVNPIQFLAQNRKDTRIALAFANGLSEILCVYAVMTDNNVVKEITDGNYGIKDIEYVFIPICENWPIADFYIKINDVDIPLAISVKSGNQGGHHGTILPCLNLDTERGGDKINSRDLDAFASQFIETLDVRSNKVRFNGNFENLANTSLTILENTLETSTSNNAMKMMESFDTIMKNTKDDAILRQAQVIYSGNAQNIVEKFFVRLFSTSKSCIDRIRRAVVLATQCHKMTITLDGKIKVIEQNMNRTLELQAKGNGVNCKPIYTNGEITGVEQTSVQKQGQFICYNIK